MVTGASSGIGRAIAVELGRRGVELELVGRRAAALEAVAEAAGGGAEARVNVADLAQEDEVRALGRRLAEGPKPVDLLIHSAGVISTGTLESADVAELDRHYATNLRAPYLLTQLLLPSLRSSGGQIVFVNSSAGLATARAEVGQYAASKHALRAMTDSLRAEVNADGIRVLSIYPGKTAGPMQERLHAEAGQDYVAERLLQPGDVARSVADTLCLPRTAEVTDISIRPMAP